MKIGLGTAQFGADYGISNRLGTPSGEQLAGILAAVRRLGAGLVDTSPLYGDAEDRIGERSPDEFLVVTKTRPGVRPLASLRASLERMKRRRVYGCLIHHSADVTGSDAAGMIDELVEARRLGLAEKIGVSVYNEGEIEEVLKRFKPDIIQLPANIFDQRLVKSGCVRDLKRRGIEIHARSILLQGLLLMSPNDLPTELPFAGEPLRKFDRACAAKGCTRLEAAVAYARSVPDFDWAVVGVANEQQLEQVVGVVDRPLDFDFASHALDDERILMPPNWASRR